MNNEFFDALELLERERGIKAESILEKIRTAIMSAVKRDYGDSENIIVEIDAESKKFNVKIKKKVVEDVTNPKEEILIDEALKISKKTTVGSIIEVKLKTKEFGRIAAQTAKHVLRQGLRDAERQNIFEEFQSKEHELLTATVAKIDDRKGFATLEIGKSEAILPKAEMVVGEELREGDKIKVYVVEVTNSEKGPKVMISRTHPGLVKRLFELEVPEIYDGTVEIKSISREAGSRTKIAVYTKNSEVDAVGSCIGPKGARVANIVNELNGEKIDIVKYSEDAAEYIKAALSPADVVDVEIDSENEKACKVIVPDSQLSLAIGNKGQNARLAARLTGFKIDIRPESGFFGE